MVHEQFSIEEAESEGVKETIQKFASTILMKKIYKKRSCEKINSANKINILPTRLLSDVAIGVSQSN